MTITKKMPTTDLTSWIASGADRLWATSYTVDEHEAFALFYRFLGGRVPTDAVRLSYHSGAFRRAGQGAVPRSWLNPFRVPPEDPLPTFHPKLILAETLEGHKLVVSTANIARDDFRETRNVAVCLPINPQRASRLIKWIERPPGNHRALCLAVGRAGPEIVKTSRNESTLAQIEGRLERCNRCRSSNARAGRWVVAAPFWSPAAIIELLTREPYGAIEAYFRTRETWDQIGVALDGKPALGRVKAYELRQNGELCRWHHKVLAWRCCNSASARAALYLGSANATVCGMVGRNRRAVNWEAGVVWSGGLDLWDYGRRIARAGFNAVPLGTPRPISSIKPKADDELGPMEEEEQRMFAAHAANSIIVRKFRKIYRRASAMKPIRVLGREWSLSELDAWIERVNQVELQRLKPRAEIAVPKDARVRIRALFRSKSDEADLAETWVDVVELDPEPPEQKVTKQTSIAIARFGLGPGPWTPGNGGDRKNGHNGSKAVLSDVRFPFPDFFAQSKANPDRAVAWLKRIKGSNEPALEKLPEYWRRIAAVMSDVRK